MTSPTQPTVKTAMLLKDGLPDFNGRASLYRVDPPISGYQWGEEPAEQYQYVVVSAATVQYSGIETYIFGANEDGKILDWSELPGSCKGTLQHADALDGAGYTIVENK